MSEIHLSNLERALHNLRQAIAYADGAANNPDRGLYETLRGGAIQAFENTYELSVGLVRRVLAEYETQQLGVADLSYAELWRLAAQRGITNDPKRWMAFRQMRNATSHTYDEKKAAKVFSQIPEMITEVEAVLLRLERMIHAASG